MKKLNYQLIWAVPLLLISIFYGVFRIDYTVLLPGGLIPVQDKIQIENRYNQTGSISSVYVYTIDRPTRLINYVADFLPGVDSREMSVSYSTMTNKEIQERGYILYEMGIDYSLINAYEVSASDINYVFDSAIVTYVFNDEIPLEIGDRIYEIDGQKLYDIWAMSDYMIKVDEAVLTINDGEEVTIYKADNGKFGFEAYSDYLIYSSDPVFEIEETDTQGSSGGLLQTISIFNALTPIDYTYGLNLGGTGTINLGGYVGSIGAVRQKVIAAAQNDIDIFFVPSENYEDALDELSKIKTDMILVEAETFADAVSFLREYGENNG